MKCTHKYSDLFSLCHSDQFFSHSILYCFFLFLFCSLVEKNQEPSEPEEPPQSIYLEGALPHESQILVADSETVTEGVYNEELNGSADEPAVNST